MAPNKETDSEQYEIYRHSASHLMASAIMKLWPDTMFAIGPPTRLGEKYGGVGFYYDLDMEHVLTPEDLPKIEGVMRQFGVSLVWS